MTEVFAAALTLAPPLLNALVEHSGFEPAAHHEVRTQVRQGAVTIDLQVRGFVVGSDNPSWVIWSEHKIGDRLTEGQLQREHAALGQATSAPSKLIAITRDKPDFEVVRHAERSEVELMRWHDQALIVGRLLQDGSVDPQVHNTIRDWGAFLQHELDEVVDPLDSQVISHLLPASTALLTVDHLLEAGFEGLCERISAGKRAWDGLELAASAPEGSWLLAGGLELYAKVALEGFGAESGPCLVVGVWAQGDDPERIRKEGLSSAFSEKGFTVVDVEDGRNGYVEFGRELPLAAVAAERDLAAQEAAWIRHCEVVYESVSAPVEPTMTARGLWR